MRDLQVDDARDACGHVLDLGLNAFKTAIPQRLCVPTRESTPFVQLLFVTRCISSRPGTTSPLVSASGLLYAEHKNARRRPTSTNGLLEQSDARQSRLLTQASPHSGKGDHS